MSVSADENLPEAPELAPPRMPLLWLRHHPWFWLVCALAPLSLLSLMIAGTILQATRIETRHTRYLKALDASYRDSDLSATSRYFQKLQEDNYRENENARFIQSLLMMRAGLTEEAQKTIELVAPDDRQGYRPAHLWRAKQSAAMQATLTQPELESTRHHLECALGLEDSDLWVRTNLGSICSALNDYNAAAEHIGMIAPENPSLYVMLAAIHKQMGNTDSQIAAMEKARDHLMEELQNNPDDERNRLSLAVLHFQLGSREEAMKVVTTGLEMSPNDRELKNAYSELLIGEYDELRGKNKDASRQLKLLKTALEVSPENPRALDRLQQMLRGTTEETKLSREILSTMLVQGEALDAVHFVLGVQCVKDGDLDKAEFHFHQSYELTNERSRSKIPVLLNNLVWLMAKQKKDLPEALELIEQAIDLLPHDDSRMPYLQETKGQVHMAMENWRDAVRDLEQALKGLPESEVSEIHQMLFVAYTRLGFPEVAQQHKKLLKSDGQ